MYEWEEGEVLLSSSDFPKFRRLMVTALNEHQTRLLNKALAIHADLVATAEKEKGQSLEQRIEQRLIQPAPTRSSWGYGATGTDRNLLSDEDTYAIRRALLARAASEPHLLRSPKRDQFPHKPLPPAGHPARALTKVHNQTQDALYDLAKGIYPTIAADPTKEPLAQKVARHLRPLAASLQALNQGTHPLASAMLKPKPAVLQKPTIKAFPPYKTSATDFSMGETSLVIDPKTRMVRWAVPENNHAVEHAWAERLGQIFGQTLKAMTWTRGTGGHFRYASEQDRDYDHDEVRHGSRISQRFGPLGDAAYEQQTGYNPRTLKVQGLSRPSVKKLKTLPRPRH
jgi:hypothetical protein